MDQQILFLINHAWARPWLDPIMAAASSWDLWWPFLVIAGAGVLIFGGFRGRAMVLAAALAIGITDGLVVDTLKDIVGRPRPHEVVRGVRTLDLEKATPRFAALAKPLRVEYSNPGILPPHGNSFPSGHAANNFAFATVLALFFRRWGWLAFFPAALVSYSRIYVGSHWPLDVLVSCLIGSGIALLTVAALEGLWRFRIGRRFPRVLEQHPSLLVS
ncbi:MAG: phosphatase PAP2 family protein [Terrimicrobiaceae bacterium]|nr:phosphatase PAP2 family protein [Terrimicrobiaceae bacterium]